MERRTPGGWRVSRIRGAAAAVVAIAGLAVPIADWTTSAGAATGTVTGQAFVDFNDNGVLDTAVTTTSAIDRGLAGVSLAAYDATGSPVGTATTATDGSYSINVASASTNDLRIEFATPAGYQPGFHGTSSGTNVQFVALGATNVNAGFVRPGDFCQNNPTLTTTCFRFGDISVQTNPGLLSFPYDSGAPGRRGDPAVAAHTAGVTTVESYDKMGATYGVAYQRSSKTLFTGAFTKTGTGLGPAGNDAIYRVSSAGAVSTLINLDTVLGAGALGPNPRAGQVGWNYKFETPAIFDLVGKSALGDLDISEDGSTLFTVDLANRRLVEIPLVGNPPTAGTVLTRNAPTPTNCNAADVQPFGLGVQGTTVYLGMVCSAESSQDRANLRAYVWPYDTTAHAFAAAPVLDFSLNFARGCGEGAIDQSCKLNQTLTSFQTFWRPWISKATSPVQTSNSVYSQPELADIVFDNGNIVLTFRDRYADQLGVFTAGPRYPADPFGDYFANGNGDIMRACGSPSAGWTIETGATCGGITTGGTVVPPSGVAQGPGGGEYYFQDNASPDAAPITVPRHDETVFGGAVQVPGFPQVAVNTYDPVSLSPDTGGVRWMNNATGADQRDLQLYRGTSPGALSKANGLGDLEALCDEAPIQLGNRVWRDTNGNGVQDAGEPGIAGVTVHLFQGPNAVGTVVTPADGTYYFDGSNVPGGVLANTAYTIKIDNPADSQGTGPLVGLTLTIANAAGVPIQRNSDASAVAGIPTIAVTTGGPGASNHDLDVGFSPPVAALASLGDRVWLDANGNGIQDAGETGVANVTVTLFNSAGASIGTTTTDATGIYGFANLVPGTYSVGFTLPNGYKFTKKNATGSTAGNDSDADLTTGKTATTTLAAGQSDLTWDAGIFLPACVGDTIWQDTNANGIQDAGEPGIAGATVTLYDAAGNPIGTVTTTGTGKYQFCDLPPGTYVVGVTPPAGSTLTAVSKGSDRAADSDINPATGKTPPITLTSGQNDTTWDAGIVPASTELASLGDFVWIDTNTNGAQDAGEPGIGGVIVTLFDSSGTAVATTTTTPDGRYAFTGLVPGTYSVGFTRPSGYFFTPTGGGTAGTDSDANQTTGRTGPITLVGGQNDITWDAGVYPLSSLGDIVWLDNNANGAQDVGEPGVAGVEVFLLDGSGNQIASTVTNANGGYQFVELQPGKYQVRFVLPNGYTFTTANGGSDDQVDSDADATSGITAQIVLPPGVNDPTWDAGLIAVAVSPTVVLPATGIDVKPMLAAATGLIGAGLILLPGGRRRPQRVFK